MADGSIGLWTVPLAVFGGAIDHRQLRRALEHSAMVKCRCARASAVFFGAQPFNFVDNTGLVGFQHFANAFINFNTITIKRNMTASDHDAGAAL